MAEHYVHLAQSDLEDVLQHVWVAGPGTASPGELLTGEAAPLTREQAQALAIDLSRRSTPAEGGFCTFQPVVDGGACPWNLDCHNCDKFVLSGADLLYWRRKREQWRLLAEGAPDDATADYLHPLLRAHRPRHRRPGEGPGRPRPPRRRPRPGPAQAPGLLPPHLVHRLPRHRPRRRGDDDEHDDGARRRGGTAREHRTGTAHRSRPGRPPPQHRGRPRARPRRHHPAPPGEDPGQRRRRRPPGGRVPHLPLRQPRGQGRGRRRDRRRPASSRSRTLAAQDDEHEATWRERALNAEDALKAAHAEILAQRTRIGELLGQVRDLQAEWTEEAIQRITTENTTLKQRVRQLTTDNRTLDERLKAARSNLRFQDRRIADLEAQLAPPE